MSFSFMKERNRKMANALKYKDIVDWTMEQLAAGVFKPQG